MQILDGQKIADELLSTLKQKPTPKKFLAGFVVGSDAASLSFQQLKKKTGEVLSVDYRIFEISEAASNEEVRAQVAKVAADSECGGVIVQLPLPAHFDRSLILSAIPKEKDVDVIGEAALGAFYVGANPVLPPAVATLQEVMSHVSGFIKEPDTSHFALSALRALRIAIVGPGFLVGRPIATWLMQNHAAHLDIVGRGGDLSALKNADLVILGAGQAGMIKPEMLKPGAGVVDFSYSKVDGKLVGDLDATSFRDESGNWKLEIRNSALAFFTPTPAGTGPILVAKLFENFYALNTHY